MAFQLHESTQRTLVRMAFMLFGLLPMLVCLAFCVAEFLPSTQRARAERWETLLASRLGFHISIARAEHPAPDRHALHNVQLRHPETHELLGSIELIEARQAQGRWTARLHGTELDGRHLPATLQYIHDWFICRHGETLRSAYISSAQLTIVDGRQVDRLADVSIKALPDDSMEIKFHSDSEPAAEAIMDSKALPSRLIVKRNQQAGDLSTLLTLNAATPLPGSLISHFIPQARNLGERVTVTGKKLELELRSDRWQLRLENAILRDVDFGLLTQDTGVAVTGVGNAVIENGAFTSGRVDFALLHCMLGSGRIGNNFLKALGDNLDVEVRPSDPVNYHPFDSAAFTMFVGHEGLQLAGQLPNDSIATDARGSLASRAQQKWGTVIPLQRLMQVLESPPPQRTARNLRLSQTP